MIGSRLKEFECDTKDNCDRIAGDMFRERIAVGMARNKTIRNDGDGRLWMRCKSGRFKKRIDAGHVIELEMAYVNGRLLPKNHGSSGHCYLEDGILI